MIRARRLLVELEGQSIEYQVSRLNEEFRSVRLDAETALGRNAAVNRLHENAILATVLRQEKAWPLADVGAFE